MWITVDQLAHLVRQTSLRYRHTYRVDNPQVLAELIRRDYPRLEGVYAPPTIASLREAWIPPSWVNGPTSPNPPQLDIQSPEGVFDTLRSSPAAAFGYLTMRYNGYDSEEAMKWARLDGLVFNVLQMSPSGMAAARRAISGQTGLPADSDRIEGQRLLDGSRRMAASGLRRAGASERVPGPACDNVISPLVTRQDSGFPLLNVPERYNVPPPLSAREFRAGLENGHPGGAFPNPGNVGPPSWPNHR
jgi:hypothetical protein